MTNKTEYYSDLAIPPGEYLEEVLEDLGMTKEELARRMGRPASKLSQIFNGTKAITPETALQLEKVLGIPSHIWTGLETEYRLTKARNEEAEREEQLKSEAPLTTKFCYNDLEKLGVVKKTRKPLERVKSLTSFFGVTSLKNIMTLQRYKAAFRCIGGGKRSREALASWLRLGELRAQKFQCAPFDEKRLRNLLPELRKMTCQNPEEFEDSLIEKLAECGIALVMCPHFPKTHAHGATFWLRPDKAVVMITLRRKWADIFWFSLFHEIGHILLHGTKAVIVEHDGDDYREKEADEFAANTLIPEKEYMEFLNRQNFYRDNIINFARRIQIHPGIIAGRLQHDNILKPEWRNELRVRYEWKDNHSEVA